MNDGVQCKEKSKCFKLCISTEGWHSRLRQKRKHLIRDEHEWVMYCNCMCVSVCPSLGCLIEGWSDVCSNSVSSVSSSPLCERATVGASLLSLLFLTLHSTRFSFFSTWSVLTLFLPPPPPTVSHIRPAVSLNIRFRTLKRKKHNQKAFNLGSNDSAGIYPRQR